MISSEPHSNPPRGSTVNSHYAGRENDTQKRVRTLTNCNGKNMNLGIRVLGSGLI
jgi:hypothetical protein